MKWRIGFVPSLLLTKKLIFIKTYYLQRKKLRYHEEYRSRANNGFYINRLSFLANANMINKKEKNYNDLVFLPLFNAIVKSLGQNFNYEHREASLISMTNLMLQQKIIKKRSEGYLADGIVTFLSNEMMIIEACGAFGTTSMSKVQFDRHKGAYGLLGMLKTIADKFQFASLPTFEKLEVCFLHTKGNTYIL